MRCGEGGGLPTGPFKASPLSCSMVGPRKGAVGTGWSVELWTGQRGSCLCPGLGEEWEEGRLRIWVLAPAISHKHCSLSHMWICGLVAFMSVGKALCCVCTQPHKQLCMECLDPNWLVQSPDLSLSWAWLQLLLSHGHGGRGSDDPGLPPIYTDCFTTCSVRSFQNLDRAGPRRHSPRVPT